MTFLLLLTCLFALSACGDKIVDTAVANTVPDAEFNALFTRSGGGWTGGDGAYSVLLPDGRTVWLFGDTFLDTVRADRSRPQSARLINNTLVIQDGSSLSTLHGGSSNDATAYLIPPTDDWYWPLDGTVQGDALYLFFSAFNRVDDGQWGFAYAGHEDVAVLSLPDLQLTRVATLPDSPVAWGAALLETAADDHTYIYGLEDTADRKYMHLARAPATDLLSAWSYYDGNDWSTDPAQSKRLFDKASNQFSVLAAEGRYFLITQTYPFGREIVAYEASAPWGPWQKRRLLYTTPEEYANTFTYNAVAHPQFTRDGELLISYNVNSFEFQDLFDNADIYKPRFVRVPFFQP